ncbi:MAG TPA: lysophospholipid acyltransferase family protein [Syntrophales bacterium]|nr:lysophospholipid acyltransferase family protein [Syntrophales bacterium]
MSFAAKRFLDLQYLLGRIAILFIGPLYFLFIRIRGYRVRDLRKVRRQCAAHFERHKGPWIVCANHLTMIDSGILIYSMMSLPGHFLRYRLLPWNLPERDNFQRNIFLSLLCYLTKCIPVSRGGDREEMKKTLDRCNHLLAMGQNLMIFPEGGRSRTGRVDTRGFSYGVGRFVKDFEDCMVMCIYSRGDGQHGYGTLPRFGERFTVKIEVFRPERPAYNGLRAQREYAEQIIRRISDMEEKYFASDRKRHCQPDRRLSRETERQLQVPEPRFHAE